MKVIMRLCIYLEIKAQAPQKSGTGKPRTSRRAVAWKAALKSEVWFSVLTGGSAVGAHPNKGSPRSQSHLQHPRATPVTLEIFTWPLVVLQKLEVRWSCC